MRQLIEQTNGNRVLLHAVNVRKLTRVLCSVVSREWQVRLEPMLEKLVALVVVVLLPRGYKYNNEQ